MSQKVYDPKSQYFAMCNSIDTSQANYTSRKKEALATTCVGKFASVEGYAYGAIS